MTETESRYSKTYEMYLKETKRVSQALHTLPPLVFRDIFCCDRPVLLGP